MLKSLSRPLSVFIISGFALTAFSLDPPTENPGGFEYFMFCNTPPCVLTGAIICSVHSVTVKRDLVNPTVVCLDVALTNSTTSSGCGGAVAVPTFVTIDFGGSILPGGTTVMTNFGSPTNIPPNTTIIGKLTVTLPPGTAAGVYKVKIDVFAPTQTPIMLPSGSSCCATICVADNLTAGPLASSGSGAASSLSCALPGTVAQKGFSITNCDLVNPRSLTFSIVSRQTSSISPAGSGDNYPISACGTTPSGSTSGPGIPLNGAVTIAPGATQQICFWTSSFPGCQPGSNCQYYIEIRDAITTQVVGCAESSLTTVSSNWVWGSPIPTTVGPTVATLRINNQVPSAVAPGTHVVNMSSGDIRLSITDGGTQRPFILATGNLSFGALPIPIGGGFLDLASPFVLLDGIGLTVGPFDVLARTNFDVTATVAAPCSGYVSPGFQGIYLDAGAPPFFLGLTEAGAAAQPPIGTVVTTVGPSVDDGFINVPISCGPVPFYGQFYTTVAICSNGRIQFGPNGNADLSESVAELATQSPQISLFWDDLLPTVAGSPGGSITTNDSVASLSVTFNNIRRFNAANGFVTGTLNVNKLTGEITYTYGAVGPVGLMVAISPGNNLFGVIPPEIDMSTLVTFAAANPLDPIYEHFTATGATGDIFDLANQSMRFTPLGGVGVGPYFFQRP